MTKAFEDWPGANCNPDFCALTIHRGGRAWHLLAARGKDRAEERALAAACDRVDIVVSERWLPRSCHPRWIKADRGTLERTGGLSFDLSAGKVRTVAQDQGEHGWWRIPEPRPWRQRGRQPTIAPGAKPPQ